MWLWRFTVVVGNRCRLPFEFFFSLVRIISLLGPRELFGFFSLLLDGIFCLLLVMRLLLKRLVARFVIRLVFFIRRLWNRMLVLPDWLLFKVLMSYRFFMFWLC